MSRNGSGVYSLPVNSWNPAINGVSATAADWQNLANDIAAALTQSLSSDGQTPVTGPINFGNNNITNVSSATLNGSLDFSGAGAIYTAATERIRIDTSGNVGIGTSSPAERLHVQGDIRIQQAVPEMKFVSEGAVNRWFIGANISDSVNGGLFFGSGADIATGTTRMAIDANGNVGIGITSPSHDLHVFRASGANTFAVTNSGTTGSDYSILYAAAGSYTTEFTQYGNGATFLYGNATSFNIGLNSAGPVAFYTNAEERMRIASNGAQSSVIPGGSTLLPQFACRAWVNFNGTGTVEIRASGNVSSITDNGTGDYTVNFTTAMPDANYSASMSTDNSSPVISFAADSATARTASAIRVRSITTAFGLADPVQFNVAIFR